MSGADAMLLERLEESLWREGNASPAIARLERATLTEKSSYAAELVTLHLANGRELRIFLKDFGSYKRVKEDSLGAGPMRERRWRELSMYRDLLSSEALRTPHYHGVVWDEGRRLFWLLLEYVEGEPLTWRSFEDWLEAARWLGRMQGHFAGVDLSKAPFLVEHAPALFASVAEEALRATHTASARLARRLRSALREYNDLFELMGADRSALVHGAYRPCNILIPRGERGGVCVLDWEESARGSPLYDLAFLADGFDRKPPRLAALLDGYEQAVKAAGLPVAERNRAYQLIYAFAIHWNLKTLTKAESRKLPLDGVSRLVDRVEELAMRLS